MTTPNIEELIVRNESQRRDAKALHDVFLAADNIAQLQSQAERIKALELGKKYAKCLMMNQAPFDEALAALAQQGEPVCAGCGIPVGDVHMSTCKSGKWPSRVSNGDTAAPAPQAQGETK